MTSLSGLALHSGVPSTVRFTLRPDDGLGLRFFFPGFPVGLTASGLATLTRSAQRATVLTDPATGATIRTPEHLIAAALFFSRAPLDIVCDVEEIPGLDGSARPWFTALAATVPVEYAAPPPEYQSSLMWSYDGPEGSVSAEPSDGFSVEYTLARGDFRQTARLATIGDAPATVLPARTFIFHDDWERLKASGTNASSETLLGGADENSGLLLSASRDRFPRERAALPGRGDTDFPLLHPRAWRLEDEAARHKVLDLLGDLALAGLALPRLRLTIVNGGHALNHLLLDALRAHGS